jgi:hypothetical protein
VSTDPKDGPADRSREDVRFDTCRLNSEKGGVRVKGLRNCAARGKPALAEGCRAAC